MKLLWTIFRTFKKITWPFFLGSGPKIGHFIFLPVLIATPCFAQTGADVLLNDLSVKGASTPTAQTTLGKVRAPTDLFQQQLWAQSQTVDNLPFDIRQWTQYVLNGDYKKAAHLWTALQPQMPENFRNVAEATQTYLLWKLDLPQTFFNQWVKNLANPSYAQSAPEYALESVVTGNMDLWLLKNQIIITTEQRDILSRLPGNKPFVPVLKAWSNLRDPVTAEEVLSKLSAENKLSRFVAETAAFAHVKKNDLAGAAKLLKAYMEPAVEASHDVELLAKHDVNIARILYQAGQLPAAAEFYQKIPNRSRYYLPSREELSWVYLRLGDMAKLRGELAALSSPVFKDRFQPELFLLKSVSDLKMCFYDNVQKDLDDFSKSNVIWAKKIDQALASSTPQRPADPDEYTVMSTQAVDMATKEMKALSELGTESISATLPAVGEQKHWKDYRGQMQTALEEAKKIQGDNFRRQWRNEHTTLLEAIRKMQFVKVEFMSQVRQLSAETNTNAGGALVANNTNSLPGGAVVKDDGDKLNFPASSELWPDELFKLRSAAQAQCLKRKVVR